MRSHERCVVLAFAVALGACATVEKESSASGQMIAKSERIRVERIPPIEADVNVPYLLLGFDSMTTTLKQRRCVKFNGQLSLPPIDVNQAVDRRFEAHHDTQRDEVTRRLELSSAAKLAIGPFSVGGGSKIVRQFTTAALHQALVLESEVTFPPRKLPLQDGLTLTDEAKGFLDNGTFFRECGDRFIQGDLPGGRFQSAYVMRSLSDKAHKETAVDAELAVSAVNLGGSVGFRDALTRISTRSTVFLEFVSKGPGDPVPVTPDEIFAYGRNFVANVKKRPGILGLLSADYGSLVSDSQWNEWDRHRQAAHEMLAAMEVRTDQETSLQLLKERSAAGYGYVFPQDAEALLQVLKATNGPEKVRLETCLGRADCHRQPKVVVSPLRVSNPFTVTLLNPAIVGDQFLTRQPGVVLELFGRWTAVESGPVVCDRITCTRNSFTFQERESGVEFTARANKTCTVPLKYDAYINFNTANLKSAKSDAADPVRVLSYPALGTGICEWKSDKP